jgi:glycosyltransferase involved in cell wall biosynthesis
LPYGTSSSTCNGRHYQNERGWFAILNTELRRTALDPDVIRRNLAEGVGELKSDASVLIITYFFPPRREVGGRRIARFCRYLPEFGIRPTVLTVNPPSDAIDTTFPIPPGVRIERTGVLRTPLDVYGEWQRRRSTGQNARQENAVDALPDHPRQLCGQAEDGPARLPSHSLLSALRRNVISLLQIPDQQCGWYCPAIRAASRLLEKNAYSAILSSAPPWTCHLIARHLKGKYGVPWIADFRDAWVTDAWREQIPGWRDRVDRRLEESILSRADGVIAVTDPLLEQLRDSHPGVDCGKFTTISNGFDDILPVLQAQRSATGRRLVLHLGELYSGRRLDSLCDALQRLIKAGKLSPASVQVLFVGDREAAIEVAARQRVPKLFTDEVFAFLPRVQWMEGQSLLAEADVLLIVQGSHTTAVPAKFFDYLYSGKPIFAIVKEGALSQAIERTNSGVWADPTNSNQVAAKLMEALSMSPRSSEEVSRAASQFHARTLTQQLAHQIRRVADQQSSG